MMLSLKLRPKYFNPDTIGALTSGLCLVHCILTPSIFIIQTCTITNCTTSPTWWQFIEVLFIAVSLVAVYLSSKRIEKLWLKCALWISWSLLFLFTVNEKLEYIELPSFINYISAFTLIILHLFSQRDLNCEHESCNQKIFKEN